MTTSPEDPSLATVTAKRVKQQAMADREMIKRARDLRKDSTHFEEVIWRELRNYRLRGKWRRQVPFGPYIADFACHSVRLVLELDGDSHVGREEEDRQRDAFFASIGYTVLRVDNNEVRDKLNLVLEWIWATVETQAALVEEKEK